MRYRHHGTLYAKNYEFSNIENIVEEFNTLKQNRKRLNRINEIAKKQPQETKKKMEKEQIISILEGDLKVKDLISINKQLTNHINQFKELNPNGRIHYQGVLSVQLRDFLIEKPDLKKYIITHLKDKGLYTDENTRHQKVYDFSEKYYQKYGRAPSTLEFYQTFLNFKSYELRGKMNHMRKINPDYYRS